jgi:purine-cytosine permease-like protein
MYSGIRAAYGYDRAVLALSDTAATIGLIAVFGVAFPALVHVLIGFAVAQVMGEREQNRRYRKHGHGAKP